MSTSALRQPPRKPAPGLCDHSFDNTKVITVKLALAFGPLAIPIGLTTALGGEVPGNWIGNAFCPR